MKNLPLLFCGILVALASSFTGLILSSYIQLGSLTQTTETLDEAGNLVDGDPLFPVKAPGAAQQGKQVYIEMGCVYCHTQQVRRAGYGADVEREWGKRASVARDYITQDRVLLGSRRIGPDLMTVGERLLDKAWHHKHLYNPKITSGGKSTMPQFAFLYETREVEGAPSADALQFAPDSEYAPETGYEVVPTPRAEALVEYLLSLKLNYSLPEAPISE
jgi:cytochrome c oxidase cbb3-type subunit 2